MSDFENFLCFSSAMARCGGTGSAEARGRKSGGESKRKMRRRREEKKERRNSFLSLSLCFSSAIFALLPPHFPFLHTTPSQRKNKENFQNRSYHMIIHERDTKRIWIYHLRMKRLYFTFRELEKSKQKHVYVSKSMYARTSL